MDKVKIPAEYAQRCNDLLTLVGLPNRGLSFENHFTSNRKVLTVHADIIFEVAGIDYFDHSQGDIDLGSGVFVPKRRFGWRHERLLYVPSDIPISYDLLDALVSDGLNDGFPMGLIIDDERRKDQLLSLGQKVDTKFCWEVDYKRMGKLRLYEFSDVPAFGADEWVKGPDIKH